jgi:hypothetical protein
MGMSTMTEAEVESQMYDSFAVAVRQIAHYCADEEWAKVVAEEHGQPKDPSHDAGALAVGHDAGRSLTE